MYRDLILVCFVCIPYFRNLDKSAETLLDYISKYCYQLFQGVDPEI